MGWISEKTTKKPQKIAQILQKAQTLINLCQISGWKILYDLAMRLDDFAQAQVYFFIAPGYEEDFAVNCLVQMRQKGVGVALIGTTRGEMVGAQGVCIRPDLSLDHVEKWPLPELLIIPGGHEALRGLMIEPRLHRLVHLALQLGKKIALGSGAEKFLSLKDIIVNAKCKRQIIYQEGTKTDAFIQQLIIYLATNFSKG